MLTGFMSFLLEPDRAHYSFLLALIPNKHGVPPNVSAPSCAEPDCLGSPSLSPLPPDLLYVMGLLSVSMALAAFSN